MQRKSFITRILVAGIVTCLIGSLIPSTGNVAFAKDSYSHPNTLAIVAGVLVIGGAAYYLSTQHHTGGDNGPDKPNGPVNLPGFTQNSFAFGNASIQGFARE